MRDHWTRDDWRAFYNRGFAVIDIRELASVGTPEGIWRYVLRRDKRLEAKARKAARDSIIAQRA